MIIAFLPERWFGSSNAQLSADAARGATGRAARFPTDAQST
jgi:hypothetical protein